MSSRDGFLLTESAALGCGKAGVECPFTEVLKMSREDCLGQHGGETYNELRVVWKMFKNCSGLG